MRFAKVRTDELLASGRTVTENAVETAIVFSATKDAPAEREERYAAVQVLAVPAASSALETVVTTPSGYSPRMVMLYVA